MKLKALVRSFRSAIGINKFCNWTPGRNWHLALRYSGTAFWVFFNNFLTNLTSFWKLVALVCIQPCGEFNAGGYSAMD